MTVQKLTFDDKTNLYPFVDRERQICAEDINELKTKFNNNIDELILPDDEDVERTGTLGAYLLKFKDRPNTNGLGYKIIRSDFDFENIPVNYQYSIWEIRYIHDLNNAAIVIPLGVTIKFVGGKLTNYSSIEGTNTKIEAGIQQIFDGSGDIAGTWDFEKSYPQWFGAAGDGLTNDTTALNNVLAMGKTCYIPDGTYLISKISLDVNGTELLLSNNAIISSNVTLSNAIEVTADNCIIQGGTLNLPAVFDGTNTKWLYANIYVTGYNNRIKGMTLNNVQKVGIGFRDTCKCYVDNCTINGNYGGTWTGVETAHFGITWDAEGDGGTFVCDCNKINTCVQGIYVGNYSSATDETGIMLINNALSRCFNHGIYCGSGQGQVISNNNCYYCMIGIAARTQYGAVLNGNMIYLGKETPAYANVVGMSLRECVNTVVTSNVIIGDGQDNSGSMVIQNFELNTLSGNVIVGNTIQLTRGISCNAIHLGSNAYTELMFDNIISNNNISSGCNQFQGAILVRSKVGGVAYNNIISNNNINFEIQLASDAAIHILNTPNFIVKDNAINFVGNPASEITAFGVYLKTSINAEVSNNRMSCFAGQGDNVNMIGVRVEADSTLCRAELNKLDMSESDFLTYRTVYSFAADTEIRKNLLDIRIAASGIAIIPAGERHVNIPWQNCEGYGGTSGVPIKNLLIRPINDAAWAELNAQDLATVMYVSNADIVFPLVVASDCVFGWEIV